jgi:hypothetical protein
MLLDPRVYGDDIGRDGGDIGRTLFSFPRFALLIPAQAGTESCTGCWFPVFTGMTYKLSGRKTPKRLVKRCPKVI